MSLRTDMLHQAARAAGSLRDARDRVAAFLHAGFDADAGGFAGPSGTADLYYTVFALQGLSALHEPLPVEPVADWLAEWQGGATLDLVHLASLIRCWACLDAVDRAPAGAFRESLSRFRAADGGYHRVPGQRAGTVYDAFLACGAWEDLGAAPGEPGRLVEAVAACQAADGGVANAPNQPAGATAPTAAAMCLLGAAGRSVNASLPRWLVGMCAEEGGFRAHPLAPTPDLLSTAVALFAMRRAGVEPAPDVRNRCRSFVLRASGDDGSFRAWPGDARGDCEYTFYGLLALGGCEA